MMTKQEMFDKAVAGLAAQGFERAFDEQDNVCVYRAKDGKRCAWGHVDPEGTYHNPEGSVCSLKIDKHGLAQFLRDDDLDFACDLQRAHDQVDRCGESLLPIPVAAMLAVVSPDFMKKSLRFVAKKYNLTLPAVLEETEAAP